MKKVVAIDNTLKIKELRQVLARLANASQGDIPLNAKAIVIFGCPHTEAPEKAVQIIKQYGLTIPVIIAGDGRKDGVGQTEAETYYDLMKATIPQELLKKIKFHLDRDSKTTPENAQNVKQIMDSLYIKYNDKILFFNFPTLGLQAQRELAKVGYNDVFTIVPEISDEKVLQIEGWINFKRHQILGE